MLQIVNVYKSYNHTKDALSDVSFNVKPGESCALIGPNGAGKSTLIRSIIGAQGIDQGQILVNGYSIYNDPIACKQIMAYIPDNQSIYPYLTGKQYIDFVCNMYNIEKEGRSEKIESLLTEINMAGVINKRIATYSKGMKQKLLIITALVHNPKLIIMDEPFTGLDPVMVEELKDIIKREIDKGAAVLFSSHLLEVAENICTHIIMLNTGKVVLDKEINSDINLRDIFFKDYYEKTT